MKRALFQDLLDDLVDLISDGVGDTWSILVFEREIANARDRERERILNPKSTKLTGLRFWHCEMAENWFRIQS